MIITIFIWYLIFRQSIVDDINYDGKPKAQHDRPPNNSDQHESRFILKKKEINKLF